MQVSPFATDSIDNSGIMVLPTAKDFGVEPEPVGYVVVDCFGTERPFNKTLLATGILATGIETPDAYGVARDVQQYLNEHHITRIESADLVVLAADRIAEQHSRSLASVYLQWHRARRSGPPLVVALSGSCGIGKSTLATRLGIRLGITQVVTTDATREILRQVVPRDVLPELHESILDAGDDRSAVFARQAQAVTAACAAVARRSVRDGKSILFEGSHLIPGDLSRMMRREQDSAIVVERLLYLDDGQAKLPPSAALRPAERADDARACSNRDRAARSLQETMRDMSSHAGVREFAISGGEALTQLIVQEYIEGALD